MIVPLTQFADSSSGLGSLGIDGKSLIIQLITFVLAFLVLKKWAFGPIVKVMDRRRETIDQGVKLGEQMKQEQTEMEQKVAEALRDARAQADEVLASAQVQAREAIAEAEEAASKKADGIIASAQDRIKQEEARARKELEAEVVGLISDATEVIIEEKVDTKKDAALIDKALKQRSAA